MSVIEKQLDSCTVSVYPPLNPDHETVTLPENMLTQFGIVAKVNKDGVVVSGADMIYNYEQVICNVFILWMCEAICLLSDPGSHRLLCLELLLLLWFYKSVERKLPGRLRCRL